jgi:glycosyltransferase involved in cell wall biosynthesis
MGFQDKSSFSDRKDTARLSVVIPTFNRKAELQRLLESLWEQSICRSKFEVIVASDGSSDGTNEMVREMQAREWNLKLLELSNRGPAAARNAGARAVSTQLIAFTDDDCVAERDWLQNILRAFNDEAVVAVQGITTTYRSARGPLTHEVEVLRDWTTTVPTCNAAFRRNVFEATGGFDEKFPSAHNEDTDLAWRVAELGRIKFDPSVEIIHPPRRDPFLKKARAVRLLASDFLLYSKNPEKYRAIISPSPWFMIYWKVFVLQQFGFLRYTSGFLLRRQPVKFLQGIALLLTKWIALIYYFPEYRRASRRYMNAPREGFGKTIILKSTR